MVVISYSKYCIPVLQDDKQNPEIISLKVGLLSLKYEKAISIVLRSFTNKYID